MIVKLFMTTIYIPIGTAGCGKSTYYEKLCKTFEPNVIIKRISADDIRFQMLDYEHTGRDYDEKIEPLVWEKVYQQYEELLSDRTIIGIYFDCTNLGYKERSQIIIRALRHKMMKIKPITIEMIWFNIPLSQSLIWNNTRKRKVPEKIIAQQYLRFEMPLIYEYDILREMQYDPNTKEIIQVKR